MWEAEGMDARPVTDRQDISGFNGNVSEGREMGDSMRVLFVDDDEAMVKFVESEMGSQGGDFSLTTALSGYEAMKLLKTQKFDLVCTDYAMQNGDGGSLASFCQDQGIECVVLTGYDAKHVAPYLPKGARVFDKISFFTGNSCGPQDNNRTASQKAKLDCLHKLQSRLSSGGAPVKNQRRKTG